MKKIINLLLAGLASCLIFIIAGKLTRGMNWEARVWWYWLASLMSYAIFIFGIINGQKERGKASRILGFITALIGSAFFACPLVGLIWDFGQITDYFLGWPAFVSWPIMIVGGFLLVFVSDTPTTATG